MTLVLIPMSLSFCICGCINTQYVEMVYIFLKILERERAQVGRGAKGERRKESRLPDEWRA